MIVKLSYLPTYNNVGKTPPLLEGSKHEKTYCSNALGLSRLSYSCLIWWPEKSVLRNIGIGIVIQMPCSFEIEAAF